MPVYVDEIQDYTGMTTLRYKLWCHMCADTLEELHAMADAIGLKRKWFQDKPVFPHYDLIPSKRTLAIKKGAISMSSRELVKLIRGGKAPVKRVEFLEFETYQSRLFPLGKPEQEGP